MIETDAAIKESNGQWSFVLKETAQKLERERDELKNEISGWRNKWNYAIEIGARAMVERDAAIEQNKKLQAELEQLKSLVK